MGQRKRKKSKRSSSSLETEEAMAASASNGGDSMYNELKNFMDCPRQVVSEGFVKLHTDLQPRSHRLSSYRLGRARGDPGWV